MLGKLTARCQELVGEKRYSLFALLSVLVIFSGIAVIYGRGLQMDTFFTVRGGGTRILGVAGDGWIQDGSRLRTGEIAPIINWVELEFDSWRPDGAAATLLTIKNCGQEIGEVAVTKDSSKFRFRLRYHCANEELKFVVHNPFTWGRRDTRKLGAKLVSFRIGSPLGVPVITPRAFVFTFAFVFVLNVLAAFVLAGIGLKQRWLLGATALLSCFSLLLISQADGQSGELKLFAWWLLLCCLVIGFAIGKFGCSSGLGDQGGDESASWSSDGPTPYSWALALVILIGGMLRVWGISFGLPNNFHPDEIPKVNAIMGMLQRGDFNPRYFLHPSLLLYLSLASAKVVHSILALFDFGGDFREFAFLSGRLVSAAAGTFSIYLTYRVGRRLFAPFTGLLGAAILAVMPLHVTCSRYLKEDALLVCIVLGCVLSVVKAAQENKLRYLFLSGLLAGVAASSKYSGLLCVACVCGTPFLRSRSFMPDWRFVRYLPLALLLTGVGFVICTPYALFTYNSFITGVGFESRHMERGHTIPIDAWSQLWMYHVWRSIIPGMTPLVAVFGFIGMGALLRRARMSDLFLVAVILLFYLPAEYVKAKPEPQPERYILPCLPFLALAGAEAVRLLRRSRFAALLPVLALLLIVLPAFRTIALARELNYDTRDRMAHWMVANLPKGSKILVDRQFYGPSFKGNWFQVGYTIPSKGIGAFSLAQLRHSGYDYLVVSSLYYRRYMTQPHDDGALRQVLRVLFNRVPIIKDIRTPQGSYGFNNPHLTLFSLKPADFERLNKELALRAAGKISATSNEKIASLEYETW